MAEERVIVHVDMDAFFASVEQRDNPELRGKPVVVGADPRGGSGRGVVSTCSYEAREYGIHSAQPISEAYRRCPDARFLPVDGEKYAREARRIREVLRRFTPQIQVVSIDEAFLDVTRSLRLFGGKRRLAEGIRSRIEEETGLTASLGVAPGKLVAKIASDLEKPCGLVIVEPGEERGFLAPLSVRRLPGVGPKTRESLAKFGIETIGDVAGMSREQLEERFGVHGADLWRKARGVDRSPVAGGGAAKSIGHEHTFGEDTRDMDQVRRTLMRLCEKTARRLRKADKCARTVTTKVRLADFTTLTRQRTLDRPVTEATRIYGVAGKNLADAGVAGRALRLIGVSLSGLADAEEARRAARQTRLFRSEAQGAELQRRLDRAEDAVKDRFGDEAITRGAALPRPDEESASD